MPKYSGEPKTSQFGDCRARMAVARRDERKTSSSVTGPYMLVFQATCNISAEQGLLDRKTRVESTYRNVVPPFNPGPATVPPLDPA